MSCARALFGATLAFCLPALAAVDMAAAQDWPKQAITMVVPFSPGGPIETPGRIMAARAGELLGQQIVFENVPGGGGMTGAARVMRARPDGYQMVYGNIGTHAQNQSLYKRPLYNAATDFAPISLIWTSLRVLVVRKDLPAANLKEFMAYAKEKGTELKFGAAGAGSSTHVACLLLNAAMGAKTTHVPYRGTAPALQDLVAGRIDYICDSLQTVVPFIEDGSIRALAMLSPERTATAPNIPTADEQGLKGFDAGAWGALFYPRETPRPIAERMSQAISDALDTPDVRAKIETFGITITPRQQRGPEYLGKFVRDEIEKWATPIKQSGVLIE